MQVKQLNFQGYEVILVTSGAVGVGRQRLQYRKLIHSRYTKVWLTFSWQFVSVFCHKYILLMILLACSFADLQNPQMNFDGKACAAVGQSGLMAIYDTLFSQVSHARQICILVVKRVWRYLFLTGCLYDCSLM